MHVAQMGNTAHMTATISQSQADLNDLLGRATATPGVREVMDVYAPIADMVWANSVRPPVFMAYATGGNS